MTMTAKKREQGTVYHGTNVPASEEKQLIPDAFRFENYMVLKEFRGRHPAVMADRLRPLDDGGPTESMAQLGLLPGDTASRFSQVNSPLTPASVFSPRPSDTHRRSR